MKKVIQSILINLIKSSLIIFALSFINIYAYAQTSPFTIDRGEIVEGFQLRAELEQPIVTLGDPIILKLTIQNVSNQSLYLEESYVSGDYFLNIIAPDGNIIPSHCKGGPPKWRNVSFYVDLGNELSYDFYITEPNSGNYYDIKAVGEYYITAYRDVFPIKIPKSRYVSYKKVESNMVVLTVCDKVSNGQGSLTVPDAMTQQKITKLLPKIKYQIENISLEATLRNYRYRVDWDNNSKMAIITKGYFKAEIQADKDLITAGDKRVKMVDKAKVVNNQLYVPIHTISQITGFIPVNKNANSISKRELAMNQSHKTKALSTWHKISIRKESKEKKEKRKIGIFVGSYITSPLGAQRVREMTKNAAYILLGTVLTTDKIGETTYSHNGRNIEGTAYNVLFKVKAVFKGGTLKNIAKIANIYSFQPDTISQLKSLHRGQHGIIFLTIEGKIIDQEYPIIPIDKNLSNVPVNLTPLEAVRQCMINMLEPGTQESLIQYYVNALTEINIYAPPDTQKEEITNRLAALLNSSNPAIVGDALYGLVRFNDPRAFPKAVDFMTNPPKEAGIQNWRLHVDMQVLDNPRLASSVIPLLSSDNPITRSTALQSLRHIKDPANIPILIKFLDDPDWECQYDAMMGIAETMNYPDDIKNGIIWAPCVDLFKENPSRYINLWKEWWEKGGIQIKVIDEGDYSPKIVRPVPDEDNLSLYLRNVHFDYAILN